MSEPDTFEKLIADMRGDVPDVQSELHDAAAAQLDAYADRLSALVDEVTPILLPTFGSVGVHPEDDPPIYRELMGDSSSSPVTGNGSDESA